MGGNVFFAPTKAFQEAFDNPDVNSSLLIVLLAGLLLGIAVYLVLNDVVSSIFAFATNIIQWVVFSALVWFFEFVHMRKRRRMAGTSFSQCLSVVGKLWVINLAAGVLLFIVALLFPFLGDLSSLIIGVIFVLATIVLVIAWIVASFRMLKVVFGIEKGKLLINWIIINLVNGLTISFIVAVLAKLPF
jgi:hypothetical protein